MMALGVGGMFFLDSLMALYACIALVGMGNSNVFSMMFSRALLHRPDRKNEVSGLMIMGLFGGTIFPLLMGVLSDWMLSQVGAVVVMAIGVVYLLGLIPVVRREK
jgi:fucose permease